MIVQSYLPIFCLTFVSIAIIDSVNAGGQGIADKLTHFLRAKSSSPAQQNHVLNGFVKTHTVSELHNIAGELRSHLNAPATHSNLIKKKIEEIERAAEAFQEKFTKLEEGIITMITPLIQEGPNKNELFKKANEAKIKEWFEKQENKESAFKSQNKPNDMKSKVAFMLNLNKLYTSAEKSKNELTKLVGLVENKPEVQKCKLPSEPKIEKKNPQVQQNTASEQEIEKNPQVQQNKFASECEITVDPYVFEVKKSNILSSLEKFVEKARKYEEMMTEANYAEFKTMYDNKLENEVIATLGVIEKKITDFEEKIDNVNMGETVENEYTKAIKENSVAIKQRIKKAKEAIEEFRNHKDMVAPVEKVYQHTLENESLRKEKYLNQIDVLASEISKSPSLLAMQKLIDGVDEISNKEKEIATENLALEELSNKKAEFEKGNFRTNGELSSKNAEFEIARNEIIAKSKSKISKATTKLEDEYSEKIKQLENERDAKKEKVVKELEKEKEEEIEEKKRALLLHELNEKIASKTIEINEKQKDIAKLGQNLTGRHNRGMSSRPADRYSGPHRGGRRNSHQTFGV